MRATQLGLVSRGRSCGDFNAPGIYTSANQLGIVSRGRSCGDFNARVSTPGMRSLTNLIV